MFAGLTAPISPTTLSGRRTRRRLAGVTLGLLGALLAVPAAPAFAVETAATVTFGQQLYRAPVGSTTPIALQVTVKDAADVPVEGAVVTFAASTDSVTAATATLSSATATTDDQGVASVTATVPNLALLSNLTATVDGVVGRALFAVTPKGYAPGEQLASVVGQDQSGQRRDIRTALQGTTWVLVDVCAGWCPPCRQFTREVERARTELWSRYRIRLEMVTLLQSGNDEATNLPSTKADALAWKTSNNLSGNVYHAEGSGRSAVYRAAQFFTFGQVTPDYPFGGVPTHLLVNPKGLIVDAMLGGQQQADFVARVVTAAGKRILPPIPSHDPRKPVPALGSVTVDVAGQTATQTFSGPGLLDVGFGLVNLDYDDSDPALQQRIFGYQTSQIGIPLPESGNLGLRLTQPKNTLKLQSTTLPTRVFAEIGTVETNDYTGLWVDTTLPAITSVKYNTSVLVGLPALRAIMRTELEAGRYTMLTGTLPALTPELIDTLVASTYGIDVRAAFIK